MATRTESPAPSAPFVARVYKDDYREIQKLVQQYPNIETGGDLFGLWQDDKTVVIQLFIGPGKKCKRTTASFHQDIEYLHRVGSVITTEGGLCNVGEWHSHHQIGMPEPSAADRRTVFNNMPQLGLERFVLFIATIGSTRPGKEANKRTRDVKLAQINLRCFLFLGSTHKMVNGEIKFIEGSNPHRIHNRALSAIEDGAEEVPSNWWIDEESTPQPGKKKSEETATVKTLKQQAEGCGASKPEAQGQEVSPRPAVSRETKPPNLEEKGAGRPRVSRETKPKTEPPESPPPDGKPQDDQQHGRRDHHGDEDRRQGNQASGSSNENRSPNIGSPPSRGTTPYDPTQAWGGGPQGNVSQSIYSHRSQVSQYSHSDTSPPGGITQRNIQSSQPTSHTSQATAWGQGRQGNMPRSTPLAVAQHSSQAVWIPVDELSREGFF